MIHTHDAIRSHLEKRIRPPSIPRPSFTSLKETEWNPLFETYMRNRLIVGALRYETFEEKMKGHNYDCLAYIRKKLDEYDSTRNLENLVDAANLLMIEFSAPSYPNTHFSPGDDTYHVQRKRTNT